VRPKVPRRDGLAWSPVGPAGERSRRGPAPEGEPSEVLTVDLRGEPVPPAEQVLVRHDGLRALLTASRSIVEELSLPAVLRRVVAAAQTVAGARYAALGVIGPDGLLEEFVHTDMTADEVARIGDLLRGQGILGALIETPVAIRRTDIAADPDSSGFPAGHPPMTSFLGVPVRSRGTVFGNLYLTDRVDGRPFSAEDEELVLALAATAGIAIENARLYDDGRRRQDWLAAAGDITRSLLTPSNDKTVVLQRIADAVVRLAGADVAAVVLPTDDDPDSLEICVVAGRDTQSLRSLRYPRADTLDWMAMEQGAGVLLDAVEDQNLHVHLTRAMSVGPVMALPLIGEWGPRGVIVVGRIEARPRFTETELDLAGGFAAQAALALELADARADQQRLTALEDRHRIARDLHDHVIQRLYASGLSLQSAVATRRDEQLEALLNRTITDLGDTIRQIRTTIFALTDSDPGRAGPRAAILDVVRRAGAGLPTSPRISFEGPVDTMVDDVMIGELTAVISEGLTNVVRHAEADVVEVAVRVAGGRVQVVIADDGVGRAAGVGERRRGQGLGNLEWRAHQAGGTSTLRAREGGGSVLEWEVPVPPTARVPRSRG
jgi:two-component system, NarL family, sensor histidine kinase DevS